jgi:hypothetical protein
MKAMIEYATTADLRRFGAGMVIQEQQTIVKNARERSPAGSTFLSHSSADAEFLPGLIKLLENHGAAVYVDKKDPTLPPYTSPETATALRQRIALSRKFILFASKNSKESRWVPWELGIADGIKDPRSTAIFPAVEMTNDTTWTKQEYLGIYDRVVWGDLEGFSAKVWMVYKEKQHTAIELSRWIAG